jgi:hypothetical protein
MKHYLAVMAAVCFALGAVGVFAEAPATQASGKVARRELSGKWRGEKDGVTVEVAFRAGGNCTWRVESSPEAHRSALIVADLKCVEEEKAQSVGLRSDYVIAATGEKRSEIIGRIENDPASNLTVTILAAARKTDADYPQEMRIGLKRIGD